MAAPGAAFADQPGRRAGTITPLLTRETSRRPPDGTLRVNASGAPAEVAARAGTSTRGLHDAYLRCIDGHDDIVSQRIEDALDAGSRIASSSRCVRASGYTHCRHHPGPVSCGRVDDLVTVISAQVESDHSSARCFPVSGRSSARNS